MKKKNLFRRIYRLGELCALSGSLVFAACTDEAATGLSAEGAAIRFDVGLSETWESGGSAPAEAPEAERPDTLATRGAEVLTRSRGAASNISVTVIDGIPPRTKFAGPQTRGAQKLTDNPLKDGGLYDSFGLFGYFSYPDVGVWGPYISNTKMNADGSYAADESKVSWPGPGAWREHGGCSIRFLAYAPYYDEEDSEFYGTDDGNSGPSITFDGSSFTYMNASNADNQIDFLVTDTTQTYKAPGWSDGKEVPLTFKHALTAVAFQFIFTHTSSVTGKKPLPSDITGIELHEVSMSATYDAEGNVEPGGEGGYEAMLTISEGNEPVDMYDTYDKYSDGGALCWPAWKLFNQPPVDYFLMTPQTLSDDTYLTVYCKSNGESKQFYIGGKDSSLDYDVSFGDQEWTPGTTVIYTIIINCESLNL